MTPALELLASPFLNKDTELKFLLYFHQGLWESLGLVWLPTTQHLVYVYLEATASCFVCVHRGTLSFLYYKCLE